MLAPELNCLMATNAVDAAQIQTKLPHPSGLVIWKRFFVNINERKAFIILISRTTKISQNAVCMQLNDFHLTYSTHYIF